MNNARVVQRSDGHQQRYYVGENHPRAKLTDATVCQIRDLHEHKRMRYAQIVEHFAQQTPPIKLTYLRVRNICLFINRCYPTRSVEERVADDRRLYGSGPRIMP